MHARELREKDFARARACRVQGVCTLDMRVVPVELAVRLTTARCNENEKRARMEEISISMALSSRTGFHPVLHVPHAKVHPDKLHIFHVCSDDCCAPSLKVDTLVSFDASHKCIAT